MITQTIIGEGIIFLELTIALPDNSYFLTYLPERDYYNFLDYLMHNTDTLED